ncbi:MAG: hypothetical protein KatS3mg068_0239 [Candidatus Sericytochromatia bacterium]|nr:MAG: hypothetical protein KatS3mg068_0239 [Candidatus Sericytochromatia bacterium]
MRVEGVRYTNPYDDIENVKTSNKPSLETKNSVEEEVKLSVRDGAPLKKPQEDSFSNHLTFPQKGSIHDWRCIENGIKLATGNDNIKVPSGKSLNDKLLQEVTGQEWDSIDLVQYSSSTNLNKIVDFLGERDNDNKLIVNEDGTFKPKTNTIISDGAHVYVLKDFKYKTNPDGSLYLDSKNKPVVEGLKVVDASSGQEKVLDLAFIRRSRNITAFVTGKGDGYNTEKADGRMSSTAEGIKTRQNNFNPIDGSRDSESYNIRMFFAMLGDPTQKNDVQELIKRMNQFSSNGFSDEEVKNLCKFVKDKFNLNIPEDEMKGIAEIFTTDISNLAQDENANKLINQIRDAKNGGGDFKGLNRMYFNGANSPQDKVTVGDMFLYLQSEKSFVTANIPPGTKFSSTEETTIPNNQGFKAGATYLDPTNKQVFTVVSTNDGPPPTANVKKLDAIGRVEHNYYQRGVQFVNLSFENYGTSPESTEDKAKGLLHNFNNLIHGAEGC